MTGVIMKFKKIYIEITNGCNLNCDFCIKNKRKIITITKENYKYIIDKIKNHTKEIYFHILGEPLMHKDINYFINYAHKHGLLVNITTNGYLINNIENNKNIHRLNISIHSFNKKYNIDLETYLNNIFSIIDKIKEYTYINLRLWIKDQNTNKILEYINSKYHTTIENINNYNKIKITNNLYIDTFHEFIWPDLNNNYYNEIGTCKGLIDHIGILSDGRIIPCCLDSQGIITLGNIYEDNLEDILNKEIVKKMKDGFRNNYKCEQLCRHCSFLEVKNENTRLEKRN